jgi:hypothetical protein
MHSYSTPANTYSILVNAFDKSTGQPLGGASLFILKPVKISV